MKTLTTADGLKLFNSLLATKCPLGAKVAPFLSLSITWDSPVPTRVVTDLVRPLS
jgi:hypothetical protein